MRTAGTMREDQPEAGGCERGPRRRHSAAPAEFSSEGTASDARQTDRGGDGMNGNEARTEGPNAALEKIERGMAPSHVEQG